MTDSEINDVEQREVSYEPVQLLRSGSFGEATLAKAKRLVVLKKFRLDTAKIVDPSILHLLKNEAYVLLRFSHPNIVRIYHAFEDTISNTINLEIEYCAGGTLKEMIRCQAKAGELFPEDQIRKWFSQLTVGLSYMHGLRIIHRNLTSETVFLTADKQTCKIGDFGTAKLLDRTGAPLPEEDAAATVHYMAPERLIGDANKKNNTSVDMWALGVILFEMTTLQLPFAVTTDDQQMAVIAMVGIFKGKAKVLTVIDKRYSKALRTLANDRLLVVDPDKRAGIDEVLQSDFISDEVERLHHRSNGIYKNEQVKNLQKSLYSSQLSTEETKQLTENPTTNDDHQTDKLRKELTALLQEFELERLRHEQEVKSLRSIIREQERERRLSFVIHTPENRSRANSQKHVQPPTDHVDGPEKIIEEDPLRKSSQGSILSDEDCAYLGGELLTAMVLGVPSQVISLLDRGVNVNYCDNDNWTPLLAASLHGHIEIVQILLQRGADANHKNVDGRSALVFAVDGGHMEIVKILVEHGAHINDLDNAGWSPLVYAALSGRYEIGQYLIAHDPDIVSVRDDCGATPLHHAAIHGRRDFGKMLIDQGVDVNIRTTSKMAYFSSAKNKLIEISTGWTALMLAAHEGRLKFAQLLVENKADVLLKNSEGNTAVAYVKKNDELKKLLQPPKPAIGTLAKTKTLFVQIPEALIFRSKRSNNGPDDYVII